MRYQPPAPLEEGDGRELLRIVHVFAKEWLRSGRKPPGSPHRATLLRPSAGWLQLAFEGQRRAAVQLGSDEPLWLTMAHLATRIIGHHPSPSVAQLAAARYRALVLGEPLPFHGERDQLCALAGHHLAVEIDGRAELLPAEDAAAAGLDPRAQLAACCHALGHDDDDWRHPAARVHAFPATSVPIVSASPADWASRAPSLGAR